MKKFLSTFRIGMALFLAVFSSGVMPVATAYAANTNNDPAGNNGTVKIDGIDIDSGRGDEPHVGCGFNVEFYGYDAGARNATVTFEAQSPTDDDQLLSPVGAQNVSFTGHGPGATLDQSQPYTVSFAGAPQPNQGYHLKVTVKADGSQGNDTKTKVFWVTGCEPSANTPEVSASATSCSTEQGATGSAKVTVTNSDDNTNTSVTYTVTVSGAPTQTVTLADGAVSSPLTFNGLASGSHTVNITGDDGTSTSTTVDIAVCESRPTPCTATNHTYSTPWTYGGDTYPATDGAGSYQFSNEGIHLSTPGNDDDVYGLIGASNTKLSDVDALSYKTFRKTTSGGYDGTLPSYVLEVDTNGAAAGGVHYMFYEPYYNGTVTEGSWQTWDALDGGSAKWWMGAGQVLHTWDEFVATYPDAVVLGYGFNQGTSNPETYSIVQDLIFDCATTHFEGTPARLTDVTPTSPTYQEATCDITKGRLIIPAKTGVNYKVDSTVTPAGNYEYAPGASITVTAEADAGYKLDGDSSWTHTFTATPTNCGHVLGDTDTKTPTGGQGGQVLGAALPTALPATGGTTMPNPLLSLVAGFLAYLFLYRKNRKTEE